jgi:hypothetical protein
MKKGACLLGLLPAILALAIEQNAYLLGHVARKDLA